MANIRVIHSIGDLASDMAEIPVKFVKEGSKIVRTNVREGTAQAKVYAREASGPHGENYHKRITGETTGALQGEWGPHDGGLPVGGGWRHSTPNTELDRSADVIGVQFAGDVDDMVDGLFW